jgi:hypothetical protein
MKGIKGLPPHQPPLQGSLDLAIARVPRQSGLGRRIILVEHVAVDIEQIKPTADVVAVRAMRGESNPLQPFYTMPLNPKTKEFEESDLFAGLNSSEKRNYLLIRQTPLGKGR